MLAEEDEIIAEDIKPPTSIANLAIMVLDGSGSMNEEGKTGKKKAEEIVEATHALLKRLKESGIKETFFMSIIAFSEKAHLMWSQAPYRSVLKIKNEDIISPLRLTRGGGTNITEGLRAAEKIADQFVSEKSKDIDPQAIRVVIFLLSDGKHTAPRDLPYDVAKNINSKYTIATIAYGDDADKKMLKKLARSPEDYLETDDPESLRKFFISTLLAKSGQ